MMPSLDSSTVPLLDLRREFQSLREEIFAAWESILDGMNLLAGRQVPAFEDEIATYTGTNHAVAVASGTDALALTLQSFGVVREDRVVLCANAYIAALEAIRRCGAIPLLVDSVRDGFEIDPTVLSDLPQFRAVLIVHLYGSIADLAAVSSTCQRRDAYLIEDASHAHGAVRDLRRAGSFGDAGCFSAGIIKNLGAYGDAGFVTLNDQETADRLRTLRIHGQAGKNHHVEYGTNSRLDEMQAAVLRVKLRHLDSRNARRRAIAAYFNERLGNTPLLLPIWEAAEQPAFHQYVVRSTQRDALRAHLTVLGIESGTHYPTPLHRQPAWLRDYGETPSFPNVEKAAAEILSLPVFPDLTDSEVERVVSATLSFF